MIYLVIWFALGLLTFWFCDKMINEEANQLGLSEDEIDNWLNHQTQALILLTALGPLTFIYCLIQAMLGEE